MLRLKKPKSGTSTWIPILSAAIAVVSACTSDTVPLGPQTPGSSYDLVTQGNIPIREAIKTSNHNWSLDSDSSLWREGAAHDSLFVIGLKAPGSKRGIYRGVRLIDDASWLGALSALDHDAGALLKRSASSALPIVEATITSQMDLRRIRRLPFVDYVEPALIGLHLASGSCNNGEFLDHPIITVSASNGGLDTLAQVMPRMGIPDAWQYSKGDGIRVGITDSGVEDSYPAPFSEAHYATVDSYGRPYFFQYTPNGGADQIPLCDHGTRGANIALAPRDGTGVVGVAYRASAYSMYFENSPFVLDDYSAAVAILDTYNDSRARVIHMGWALDSWSNSVSDAIDNLYYQHDVVFVGAAGTCWSGSNDCPNMDVALFPASKGEVLAASGTNWDGTHPHDNFDWGAKREGVLAYTTLATAGFGSAPRELNGSSGATAMITGVAALVRSRYPTMANYNVVSKILNTSGDICHDPPAQWRNNMVNAVAAVGGPCAQTIWGPRAVGVITKPAKSVTVTYSIDAAGDNSANYTYWWANNKTGKTIQWTFFANSTWTPYYALVNVLVTDPATGVQAARAINVYVNSRDPNNCGAGGVC